MKSLLLHSGLRALPAAPSRTSTSTSYSARPLVAPGPAPRLHRPVQLHPTISTRAAVAEAPSKKADAEDPHWKQALAELDKPRDAPDRKLCVVQVAPAVRAAIGECFGLPPGAVDQAKPAQMAEALRRLGFDVVLDLTFGADVTIMEEAHELLHRLTDHLGGHPEDDHPLPMFTSCCPGWISMVEKSYPELIPYLSTCKSPQMMLGALIKTFLADKYQRKPSEVCAVSIMPCVRKQGEADREWFSEDGCARDVDHVITTAELGAILKERGIDLPNLPEGQWDEPLGTGSGAGVLFGTTGGVMEAALRTAYEVVTQSPLERLVFQDVRGLDGIKECAVTLRPPAETPLAKLLADRQAAREAKHAAEGKAPITWQPVMAAPAEPAAGAEAAPAPEPTPYISNNAVTLRVAVANGLGNAKKLITKMQSGETHYDFVEVMACPAGCISGGGQPRSTDKQATVKRQQGLYTLDERTTVRRSHENPLIKDLYDNFLGEPCGEKAHHMMHTHYVPGGVNE